MTILSRVNSFPFKADGTYEAELWTSTLVHHPVKDRGHGDCFIADFSVKPMDVEANIGLHFHDSDEELELLEGEGEVLHLVNSRIQTVRLRKGNTYVVPRGNLHSGLYPRGAKVRITFTPALRVYLVEEDERDSVIV